MFKNFKRKAKEAIRTILFDFLMNDGIVNLGIVYICMLIVMITSLVYIDRGRDAYDYIMQSYSLIQGEYLPTVQGVEDANIRITRKMEGYDSTLAQYRAELTDLSQCVAELLEHIDYLESELNARDSEYTALSQKYAYVFDREDANEITIEDIKYLDDTCKEVDINPHIITSMIDLESDYNPNCSMTTSSARGLMQILKGTGKFIWEDLIGSDTAYNHDMAYDKQTNILMGVTYMRYHLDRNSGNLRNALKCYNGGELGERYADIVYNTAANVGHPINTTQYVEV